MLAVLPVAIGYRHRHGGVRIMKSDGVLKCCITIVVFMVAVSVLSSSS